MQELISSVARFSAAITLFGIQEMQNAVGAAMDSPEYFSRFRRSLDSISDAIASELDSKVKPTLESVTNLSSEMVGRTVEVLKTPALDPRQMLQTASDMIRKTADSVSKPVPASTDAPPPAGEPRPVADVLAAI